jgi:hypothetical protein
MSNLMKKLLGLPFSLRQKRLAGDRMALGEPEFVQQIAEQGGDRMAAGVIWRFLRDWGYEDGFTPYPTDNLGSVFGIAEEELETDLVIGVLRELNIPMPTQELVDEFGAVDTPLRVALLVARCRELSVA